MPPPSGLGDTPNLGFGTLLERLGARTDRQPQIMGIDLHPMAVFADFAKTLSVEPIEARGIFGAAVRSLDATDGQVFRLRTKGCPVVIEDVIINTPSVPAAVMKLYAGVGLFDGAPGLVGKTATQIGGVDVKAEVETGGRIDAAFYPPDQAEIPEPVQLSQVRWYVEAGSDFAIATAPGLLALNEFLNLTVVFREIQ